eukprot:scaffold2576_cov175-Amphora_coffeaeformis.AAC.1
MGVSCCTPNEDNGLRGGQGLWDLFSQRRVILQRKSINESSLRRQLDIHILHWKDAIEGFCISKGKTPRLKYTSSYNCELQAMKCWSFGALFCPIVSSEKRLVGNSTKAI